MTDGEENPLFARNLVPLLAEFESAALRVLSGRFFFAFACIADTLIATVLRAKAIRSQVPAAMLDRWGFVLEWLGESFFGIDAHYRQTCFLDLVVESLRGRSFAGALHATGNMRDSFAVVSRCEGRRFVSTTLEAPPERPRDVDTKQIFATSLSENEVSTAVYVDFLSAALATGKFRPAPPAQVAGRGLERLQEALQVQKRGVSGAKVVVDLGG